MKISEAAQLLCFSRDQIKTAIKTGIKQSDGSLVKLSALPIGSKDYDIDENALNAFICAFYVNEPKRQIPIAVRRALLVEASHRCAICYETSSLEFHHIIEFSDIKHHDPQHMIVLCATDHARCTSGVIDVLSQRQYKEKLSKRFLGDDEIEFPARFSWGDLERLIVEVHNILNIEKPSSNSKGDFSLIEIEKKNELNRMSIDYFEHMRDNHQQYFGRIEQFLREPANEKYAGLYYEIVDELNAKVAAQRNTFDKFEEIMIQVRDTAKSKLNGNVRTLNILLSFTYFKCDVGRKNVTTN